MEDRYIVIKKTDLTSEQRKMIQAVLESGVTIRSGVFFDRDWKCYDKAVDLLVEHIRSERQ